ncbi:ABC transporter ATP-binding protein [Paenibacillus mucilaginosus]|uniref:Lipoprotein releasing system ATP-binding protein lolD n=2 Tax=Paenibacillus mucilaginosus TaxID=61624 RepID=F8FMM4_PAEMK|nr:ABC transporter ATP-binding protein [Paenibacillus mucilaginosus]AEI44195.1 lipoprotein releasing system ATP-binding protein lolD [Paenibacillus mucilaginosus KNP414]MCG7216610.1 ABC transporter ATP-binding protein [Paenibacillus mucilaginosus]WDM25609.1 ABC transporter ATP-binding protein [Paenibacillus mucilaginosus]
MNPIHTGVMIRMEHVTQAFAVNGRPLPILKIPAWEVKRGERLAIIGPSGSGKSSLLHLLSGIQKPDSGTIQVDGLELTGLPEGARDKFRAEKVGYIFQDFHLIPSLTAQQNVELVLPSAMPKREKRTRIREWMEAVGMADRMDHRPAQLSRGQQQRVAIVRALINRPPLLLADEPTGSLDYETAGALMALLLGLCAREGSTLITVTHDLHLARTFSRTVHIGEINALVRPAQEAAAAGEKEGVAL